MSANKKQNHTRIIGVAKRWNLMNAAEETITRE